MKYPELDSMVWDYIDRTDSQQKHVYRADEFTCPSCQSRHILCQVMALGNGPHIGTRYTIGLCQECKQGFFAGTRPPDLYPGENSGDNGGGIWLLAFELGCLLLLALICGAWYVITHFPFVLQSLHLP